MAGPDAPLTAAAASLIDDSTRTLFRDLLTGALQELIEDALTARIGAAAHERTATPTNLRKGPARRQWSMAVRSEVSALGDTTG